MPTATKKITVLDLLQELQNFPHDGSVSLKDGEDFAYLKVEEPDLDDIPIDAGGPQATRRQIFN
ncbi:hypothetical protein [Nostoc sp.]|uniref:hypothetical protein n=1 Tax=Nostoc sp. TaxID=1180 RepID=UPI002FF87CEF